MCVSSGTASWQFRLFAWSHRLELMDSYHKSSCIDSWCLQHPCTFSISAVISSVVSCWRRETAFPWTSLYDGHDCKGQVSFCQISIRFYRMLMILSSHRRRPRGLIWAVRPRQLRRLSDEMVLCQVSIWATPETISSSHGLFRRISRLMPCESLLLGSWWSGCTGRACQYCSWRMRVRHSVRGYLCSSRLGTPLRLCLGALRRDLSDWSLWGLR